MKKLCFFLGAILLSSLSSASFASIQSFWAYGSSDTADAPKYVESIGKKSASKSISIDYDLGSNWEINSATLWIKAVDDFRGGHCSGSQCKDGSRRGRDSSEQALISKIEGQGTKGNWKSVEIGGYQWYELLDVTTFLLNDTNKAFTALLKASRGGDFWYKNAKLVIDYSLKDAPGPSTVPVPSAVWLFGSALLGLLGFKRKDAVN